MLSVRLASFNVENLLHPAVRFARDRKRYTPEMYDDKIHWIGRTLDEGAVDLVGFQELFSMQSIRDAIGESERLSTAVILAPDLENDKNISMGDDDHLEADGPFVGLATTLPILEHSQVEEFPQSVIDALKIVPDGEPTQTVPLRLRRFQRPVLRAVVRLPNGVAATVFVTHMKSKLGQFVPDEDPNDFQTMALGAMRSLIVRAAESVALRALLLDETRSNNRPVILIGDLNDELSSVTTQTIAGPVPWRFKKAEEKAPFFDVLLHSVHDIQDRQTLRDVGYTHIFDGRYQLLDHIFVSQELFAGNRARIGEVEDTRIFNDHLVDDGLAVNVKSGLSARSDHGMVVAELSLKEQA